MCGRYVSPDQSAIERAWKIDRTSGHPFPRRFNVQPTTEVPVLRRDGAALVLQAARWGLVPHWWKKDAPPTHTINARLEEAAGKPMWRDSFMVQTSVRGTCENPVVGGTTCRARATIVSGRRQLTTAGSRRRGCHESSDERSPDRKLLKRKS